MDGGGGTEDGIKFTVEGEGENERGTGKQKRYRVDGKRRTAS